MRATEASPTNARPDRGVRAAVRRHPLVAYFSFTYLFSWGYWIPDAFSGGDLSHFPGLMGPMLAAITTAALAEGRAGLHELWARMTRFRVPIRWYAVALAPVVPAVAIGVAWWLLPADAPNFADWAYMPGLPHVGLLAVTALVFLVNGYGEETGWRGFAIPHLRERHGPLAASLILAVAWAVWHIPTFWLDSGYRGFEPMLIPGFFIGLAAGSIVFTWVAEGSGWSIPILALIHAALNMGSATEATQSGPIAVATTTLIIFWAVSTVHVWREEDGRR